MKKLFLILVVISAFIACSSDDEGEYNIKETEWVSDNFMKGDSIIYYEILIPQYNNLTIRRRVYSAKEDWIKFSSEMSVYSFSNNKLTFNAHNTEVVFRRIDNTLVLSSGFAECPKIFYKR